MKDTKGQFFTPDKIAEIMIIESIKFNKRKSIKILDPCFGQGVFLEKINKYFKNCSIYGYEIDKIFFRNFFLNSESKKNKIYLKNEDYLKELKKNEYDYVIFNPPYVRQENIKQFKKKEYTNKFEKIFNCKINKKSNLYIYFFLKVIYELKNNGIGTIIIYDVINQTKYGKDFFTIFNKYCKIIKVINLKKPFKNVLIDAQIIIFKKLKNSSSQLSKKKKINDHFVNFSDLFPIKRGIGLESKKVFVANKNDKFFNLSKKIILRSKDVSKSNIKYSRAYLFNKNFKIPAQLKKELSDKYFLLHKKKLKKFHHKLSKGMIIFGYAFRKRIKFYLNNNNNYVSDNFYYINSKIFDAKVLIHLLNSRTFIDLIIKKSRNQGSGLRKIQLYEFKEIKIPNWGKLNKKKINNLSKLIKVNKFNENKLKTLLTSPID